MAPMTRSRAAGGRVDGLTARYYAQRASAGLIVTEAIQVSDIGQGYIQTPGLHTAEQVAAWRRVTEAVHAEGGTIVAQLVHCGRIGHPVLYRDGAVPVAPSAVPSGEQLFTPDGMLDHPTPREMTAGDIAATVADFAAAARNAMDAGFDEVEVHGANGFLLHQFLCDGTNRRTDGYGGSIPGRIRFARRWPTCTSSSCSPATSPGSSGRSGRGGSSCARTRPPTPSPPPRRRGRRRCARAWPTPWRWRGSGVSGTRCPARRGRRGGGAAPRPACPARPSTAGCSAPARRAAGRAGSRVP
ncbi:hypothetical protein ETD96_24765 [Actinomadura geliboluensis]|uniref:NADH:flavin oxidoreductase/NADH oxidase N-terminal domain-containing protein n=1 Tax=Actinomadura geliboluensis TaxID=882440 RepID=A0A5S4GNT5_9ACTN|nr:hypothetical protein ETD96_24765 [Actinomadura geliboluensis]